MDKVEYIWRDGEMIPWDQAQTHVLTHSLHYGFAVFEGIRCYPQTDGSGGIFRLREHIDRLYDSAKICMIDVPIDREQVVQACIDVVRENKLTDGCYLRPLIYVGTGSLGIAAMDNPVHVMVAAWRWGAYLGEDGVKNGIRVHVTGYRRPRTDTFSAKGKIAGQYVTSILAKREAMKAGFDEAIMLDTEGNVVEGTGENIFVVENRRVRTPALGQAILGGITRQTALTLLEEEGIPIHAGPISRDEIYLADEAFFTGTAAEVTPIRELDHRPIGIGRPGPVTELMKDKYARVVRGELEQYHHWITKVTPKT